MAAGSYRYAPAQQTRRRQLNFGRCGRKPGTRQSSTAQHAAKAYCCTGYRHSNPFDFQLEEMGICASTGTAATARRFGFLTG